MGIKSIQFFILSIIVILLCSFSTDCIAAEKNIDKKQKKWKKLLIKYCFKKPDSAIYYAQKIIASSPEKENHLLSNVYDKMGIAYAVQGLYDSALIYFNKALIIYEMLNDSMGIAKCYNNIGNVYRFQGELKKAIEYQLKSLKIKDILNDSLGMASSLNNIGNIHQQLSNHQKAIYYFQEELEICKALSDSNCIARSLNNIASSLIEENKNTDALAYLKQAMNIREKLQDYQGLITTYINLASIYQKQAKTKKAHQFLDRALKKAFQVNDKEKITLIYMKKSDLYEKSQNYQEALRYNYKAEKHAQITNNLNNLINIYSQRFILYKKLGNISQALEAHIRYSTYRDSLIQKEKIHQLMELEARYENEKKKQELKIKNAQIIAQQERIKKEKWQKNILLIGVIILLFLFSVILKLYYQKRKMNLLLEKKNKEITDSINYAKHIQSALLPSEEQFISCFQEAFIMYLPKNIVSGDFYWINNKRDKIYFAVADCTGHGVPGAFMSIIGITLLHKIINELNVERPDAILNQLNKEIKNTFGETSIINDGMDITLCAFNPKTYSLEVASAYQILYNVRNQKIMEIKGDRYPLGKTEQSYNLHTLSLQKGDMLYLFTDGFPDQKGGPKNKKFYYPPFRKLLTEISIKRADEQKRILIDMFYTWKKDNDQYDDILIVGVRI